MFCWYERKRKSGGGANSEHFISSTGEFLRRIKDCLSRGDLSNALTQSVQDVNYVDDRLSTWLKKKIQCEDAKVLSSLVQPHLGVRIEMMDKS